MIAKSQTPVLLAGMLLGLAGAPAMAQAPREPGPVARHEKGPPLLPSSTVEGKVTRYLVTPIGDVEGVLLDNGTVGRVPPHMANELVETAKIGDAVKIEGVREELGSSFRVYSLTNIQSKQTLVRRKKSWTELSLPGAVRSMGRKELVANGTVQTLLTGPRGDPQGVILDNGTIVRFRKDAVYAASAQMKIGAKLAAKGYGTENDYGRALDATEIGESPETLKTIER